MTLLRHSALSCLCAVWVLACITVSAQSAANPGLQELTPPQEMSFPNGYDVVTEPAATASALKHMPPGTATIAAQLDAAGHRYYMTDWSHAQYLAGKAHYWIRTGAPSPAPGTSTRATSGTGAAAAMPGLIVLPQKEDHPFPGGYEVVVEPRPDAPLVKQLPESRAAMVSAYQDIAGVRYFITDWSYDRFLKDGTPPNWIRALGSGGSAVASNGPPPASIRTAPTRDAAMRALDLTADDVRLLENFHWAVGSLRRNAKTGLLKRAQNVYGKTDWRRWYILTDMEEIHFTDLESVKDSATQPGLQRRFAMTTSFIDIEDTSPSMKAVASGSPQGYWLEYLMSRNGDAANCGLFDTYFWFAREYGPASYLTMDVGSWACGPTWTINGYGLWNRIRHESIKAFRARYPTITRENIRGYMDLMADCMSQKNRAPELATSLCMEILGSLKNLSAEDAQEVREEFAKWGGSGQWDFVLPKSEAGIREFLAKMPLMEACGILSNSADSLSMLDMVSRFRLEALCRLGQSAEALKIALAKYERIKGVKEPDYYFEELWEAIPDDCPGGRAVRQGLATAARPTLVAGSLILVALHDVNEGRFAQAIASAETAFAKLKAEKLAKQLHLTVSAEEAEELIAALLEKGQVKEADRLARQLSAEGVTRKALAMTATASGRFLEAAGIHEAEALKAAATRSTYAARDAVEALLNYGWADRPEAGRALLRKGAIPAMNDLDSDASDPRTGTELDRTLQALVAVQAAPEVANYITLAKHGALAREKTFNQQLGEQMAESPEGARELGERLERIRELSLMATRSEDQEVELQSMRRTLSEELNYGSKFNDSEEKETGGKGKLTVADLTQALGRVTGVEFFRSFAGPDAPPVYHYYAAVRPPGAPPLLVDCGPAKDVDEDILKLGAAMRDEGDAIPEKALAALLRSLYGRLVKPWRDSLPQGSTRVCICPAGDLSFVPWALLMTADGAFLGDTHEVVTAPNLLAMAQFLRAGPSTLKSGEVVLVGDPTFNADTGAAPESLQRGVDLAAAFAIAAAPGGIPMLPSLPGSSAEVSRIAALLQTHGIRRRTLTGADAREEKVRAVKRPSILHFATHGFFLSTLESEQAAATSDAETHPRRISAWHPQEDDNSLVGHASTLELDLAHPMFRSALALSGANVALDNWRQGRLTTPGRDGLLTAAEAAEMDLHGTQLVILSACDTGLGATRTAAGVEGLQMAFQQAGARLLMITLWPVADEETVDFMSAFYGRLPATQDWIGAFTGVQREVVQRSRTQHGLARTVALYGPFALLVTGADP